MGSSAIEPTISSKGLRAPILAAAARTGRPPPELAQLVGLDPALVMDPDGRVPHSVAIHAWDVLAARAADSHLGLFAASLLDAAPIDFIDLALNHAPDLRAVFASFLRFQRLFHEGNACSLRSDGPLAVAVFQLLPAAARNRHLCEFVLTTWARKSARLLGLRSLVAEVRLRDAEPADVGPFRAAFGEARLRFGAREDALLFPAELLERPVNGADSATWELLRAQVERAAETPAFVDQARRLLQIELTQGRTEAKTLAKSMAVSTRSLQRRLAEHGTSFSELLDGVRHELALSHLRRAETSITEVAFLLGFSELSAFSRAFRRWTGQSPIEYAHRARS